MWSAAACNARRQRWGLLCHLSRAYYKHRDRLHALIGWECRVRCCVASHQCHSCFTNTGLEACDLQEIQVSTSSLVDSPSRHLLVITNSMKGGRTQSESPNHFMTESLPGADKKSRHTCKHCAQLGPGRQTQGAERVVVSQRVLSTKATEHLAICEGLSVVEQRK